MESRQLIRNEADPRLRQMSEPWTGTIQELEPIVDAMGAAMEEHNGVGISAIQIGVPLRLFIACNPPELFINPRIVERSPATSNHYEGCLSCPNVTVRTKRAKTVTLEYTSIENKRVRKKFKGIDAVVIQHEFDHINGFLILDRGKAYRV